MCGIAGFLGFEDGKLLRKMTKSLLHRGPDQSGYYSDSLVSLGHRRLSIIDLSENGRQPMHNEDRTVWMVYNGEIYNFKEIREGLSGRHRFFSGTDTEVMVHAYEEYGPMFVEKLNGMFAFALYDTEKKRLILARDRLGVKPLYYLIDGGRLLFSSEIKSLLYYAKPKVDRIALHRYLTLRYVPGEETIVSGVRRLMAGEMLIAGGGRIEKKRYWDLSAPKATDKGICHHSKVVRGMLSESVRMRLIADVPLGAFLSGGIDSSAIVALMKLHSDDVKTFTAGFSEEMYSEVGYARAVAEHVGTDHHEIIVDNERFYNDLPSIVRYLDEPIADPAAIPAYYVAELAKKKVKVALSGEGGDELFGGYPKYRLPGRMKLASAYYRIPRAARAHLGSFPFVGRRAKVLEKAGGVAAAVESVHADRLHPLPGERHDAAADIGRLLSSFSKGPDDMTRMQVVDIKTWLPEELLMKTDRMSMAHSLEARTPFLDYRLVEYSMTIPSKYRIGSGIEKLVLRKAVSDLLPESVTERKKHGFDVPIAEWEKSLVSQYADRVKNSEHLRGLLGKGFTSNALSKGTPQDKFNMVVLSLWCEAFLG